MTAEDEDQLGRHEHLRVAAASVSTTAATDDSGIDSSASAKVSWPASMTSSSTSRRCSALSRVAAERAEDVHDAPQAALLVDAELARAAEVDRAQPARAPALAAVGLSTGGPAAVGLIEQRVDLGGGEEVAHRRVSSFGPGLADGHVSGGDVDADRAAHAPGGRGRRDGNAGALQRGAHRGLVAGADLHAGAHA